MAATRISASRQTAARSGVLEWQMVTVACSCSSSMATGLPTMSLRPTTTARLSGDRDAVPLQQLDDAGRRAGARPGQARHQIADVAGMEAIHVLGGRDRQQNALGIDLRRQGKLHQDAIDIVAGIQALDDVQQFGGGDGIGRSEGFGMDSEILAGLDLVADVDLGSGVVPGQHDRQRGGRPSAASAAMRGASSLLISSRTRFPSRIWGISFQ